MGQRRRYFWLKLHEEFFGQTSVKYLRTMPEGEKILIVYLKLLLVSLRTDGIIFLDGLYPSMEEELALVLDENKVTVQFSLHALEKVKLLERGQDGELIMTKLPDMIGVGSEDASAQRVRAYRERKALEKKTEALQSNTGVTAMKRGSNANVTEAKRVGNADKDIEIESDKEKDAERESDASVRGRVTVEKHVSEEPCGQTTYGTYKNVKLSEEEYESLKRLFPEDYQGKIDYLSSYMASTRRKYDSHFHTIVKWAKQDAQRIRDQTAKKKFEDYGDYTEDESL